MSEDQTESASSPKAKLLNTLKFILKFALAGGVMAWLLRSHGREMLSACGSFKLQWLALATALYAFHLFANAWRWWLLLRVQKIDCELSGAVSITMQSLFFSLVIPGGAIGGDLVRAGFLASRAPKGRKFDGAFTILMDRFTGMIGIFLVALLILPFSWWALSQCKGMMDTLVKLIVAGSAAGVLASIVVFQHRKLEKIPILLKCKQMADRLTHGLPSKIADSLDTYASCPGTIAICVLASMLFVNLTLGLMAYCLLLGAGAEAPALSVAIAAITIGNIVGLLPLTPSGIGARDIFVIAILQAGGIAAGQAMAASLAITALILAFNLFGGVFFLTYKKPEPKGA